MSTQPIIGNTYRDTLTGAVGVCEYWTQTRTHVVLGLVTYSHAGLIRFQIEDWRAEPVSKSTSAPEPAATQAPEPEPTVTQAPEPEPAAQAPDDPRLTDVKALINWCRETADKHPEGLTPLKGILQEFGVANIPALPAEKRGAFIAAVEKHYG